MEVRNVGDEAWYNQKVLSYSEKNAELWVKEDKDHRLKVASRTEMVCAILFVIGAIVIAMYAILKFKETTGLLVIMTAVALACLIGIVANARLAVLKNIYKQTEADLDEQYDAFKYLCALELKEAEIVEEEDGRGTVLLCFNSQGEEIECACQMNVVYTSEKEYIDVDTMTLYTQK